METFLPQVSTSSGCYMLYDDPYRNRSASVVQLEKSRFDVAAEKNLNDIPSLKHQYFGTTDGFLYLHPGRKTGGCGTFDARSRFRQK